MIRALRGRLADKQPNLLVVDVGGVGYEVHVPLSTFYGLGEVGAEVVAAGPHPRTEPRCWRSSASLRSSSSDVFERLIAINGVGPRLALAVLSGIEPPELVRAVRDGDVARLTRIPGVGKKTAERIGLELKDRLPEAVIAAQVVAETPTAEGGCPGGRALGARQPRLPSAGRRAGGRRGG